MSLPLSKAANRMSQLSRWQVCAGSSGDRRRQGSITKNGNSYARKLLVEAAWSYRYPARVSPDIQRRHEGIPKPIIDRAWDAQVRLCRRYRRLAARGKNVNIAVVAVARELAGFIWDN
jgi:transposase